MANLQNNLRVLVVDSYADAADSLALLLGCWGHQVRVAYSSSEALLVACQFRPHVVFAELKLAGCDGFQLAELLRRQQGDGLHLAALTGMGAEAQRCRARACGFRSFLLKPADPERIRRLLQRLTPAVDMPDWAREWKGHQNLAQCPVRTRKSTCCGH